MKNFLRLFERFLKIFWRLFVSQYALMLEYRAEIVLWAMSGILPLLMLGLWIESDSLTSQLIGKDTIIRYFISVFIVRQFTAVWVMISFEEDHLEGRLSPYLLHPICPFWRYFFSHLAEQFTRAPIVFIMLLFTFIFIKDSFWFPDIQNIIIGIISILIAFILRFLLHWNFVIFCFWNDKASSIERLLLIPYIFLSGLVAPLDIYPDLIRRIAFLTPFPYIISFPALILSNQTILLFNYFAVVAFWLGLLVITSILFWKAGVSKYSAMGA